MIDWDRTSRAPPQTPCDYESREFGTKSFSTIYWRTFGALCAYEIMRESRIWPCRSLFPGRNSTYARTGGRKQWRLCPQAHGTYIRRHKEQTRRSYEQNNRARSSACENRFDQSGLQHAAYVATLLQSQKKKERRALELRWIAVCWATLTAWREGRGKLPSQ